MIYVRSSSLRNAHVRIAHILMHIRTDTTKKKREGRQNISASHYIVEGVGVAGLSVVFGDWKLFVHRYVVTFLFIRPLYMAAHTYGYAFIYPGQAIKIPARADTSGIIRSSKQDCPDDSDFHGPHPSSVSPSYCHHSPLSRRAISVRTVAKALLTRNVSS